MHDDHHGRTLAEDLQTLVKRRKILGLMALAGITAAGCGDSASTGNAGSAGSAGTGGTGGTGGSAGKAGSAGTGGTGGTAGSSGSGGTAGTGGTSSATCSKIPEETGGPFPGDGTNGANALTLMGIVRSDITSSFDGPSGVAEGVPMSVTLTLVDASAGCAPLAGYAVYLWHCDRDGEYSMYTAAAVDENYLRGVQEADDKGQLTFETIFPGCYPGRWPHMHFEVYPSLASATNGNNAVSTSQLALPEADCKAAYATPGYEASVNNLAGTSLTKDGVFKDGVTLQMAEVSGNPVAGYTAKLTVAINA
jgi:protocatechuate 3,4-dioxygenase beta subunit